MSTTAAATQRRSMKFPELVIPGRPRPTLVTMALATGVQADTYGWDTVYAVPMSLLNAEIAKKKSSPALFAFTDPDTSNTIQGAFGDWKVTPAGVGQILTMEAPVTAGEAIISGTAYSLAGCTVKFTVQLEFLPQPSAPTANGTTQTLATGTSSVVEITSVNFPSPPSFGMIAIITAYFQQWLNANLQQFHQVFSVVTVNAVADTGAFQWLKPSEVGYAIAKQGDGTGIFGILATTGTRSSTGLSHTLSPSAIPTGAPSGFLISSERFLTQVIQPALPATFSNAKQEDFELLSDTALRNKIPLTMTFEAGGKTYTGAIDTGGFHLSVVADKLHLDMPKMTVNVSPGIDIVIDLHEEMHVSIKPRGDGTNVLWFEQTEDDKKATRVDHSVEYATWVEGITIGLDFVVMILGAVIGAVGGAARVAQITGFSRIASKIIAGVIGAVIAGIAVAIIHIPNYIGLVESGKFNQLPALENLLSEGISTIEWPNSSGYRLITAGLNKSLQLGLELV